MTSGHMANEGDESQVTSLSSSNINIQKSRRVTFSVGPGNEGAQRSTSVPSEGEALGNVVDVDPILRLRYEQIDMTTVGLRRSKRCKSDKNKCHSTIKNIGFTAYCAFTSMTTFVRGQIATISESREIQNVQRVHSNVNWTRNICQSMALITAMTGKDTLTYGEMKRQPDKPQFITAMQKEISNHEKRKHWKLVHRSETKGAKTIMAIWSFRRKRDSIIGKVTKYKSIICTHGGMPEKGLNYW